MRILIIDDNEGFAETTADILDEQGYDVLIAFSGESALECIREESVDVALVDINLPDYSGTELLLDMKLMQTDLIGIIITGYSSLEAAVESLNIGADSYLTKPIDMDVLKQSIEKAMLKKESLIYQKQIMKNERRLTALHESAVKLSQAEEIQQIWDIAFNVVTSVLGFKFAGIAVPNDDYYEYIRYLTGVPVGSKIPFGEGVTSKVFETGETIYIRDCQAEGSYIAWNDDFSLRSELVVPIKVEDKVIAIINVEDSKVDAFDQFDQYMLELTAEHTASAIMRIGRMDALEELVEERTSELRESNERLKEVDKLRNHLLSTATHELRTPLASILGYTEYILSGFAGDVQPEVNELLQIIYRNSERLKSLTDDLLDQQRLGRNAFQVSKERFDILPMVKEVYRETAPLLAEKNIKLSVSAGENVNSVEADRIRIIQVLINLIHNSIKYSPENTEIKLKICVEDEYVKFCVSDEGMGLTQEDMNKLFQPFPGIHREHALHGTGLGLSICKGIIDLHDGRIWADSEGEDKGACFSFIIPDR